MKKILIIPTLLLLTCCYVSPDEAVANDNNLTRADSTETQPQTGITIQLDTVWKDTIHLPIDPEVDVDESTK